MSFSNLKPATLDEGSEQKDSTFLRKEDLDGEIIAFDVVDYDAQYEGNFGKNPRITVDLIICSGPHKGEKQDNTYFSNNLAVQMHKAAAGGGATVVKVTSGNSKYGTKWYGVDAVSESDFAAALEVVQDVLGQAGQPAEAPF